MTKTTATKKLFTTEQLENWKDQIAEWWGSEKLRYDHKQVVELFRKWFGVSKQDAIEMEFNSREDSDTFIEDFLYSLATNFEVKLRKGRRVARLDVSMSFQDGAYATTEFPAGSGQVIHHLVPGHAGIVGQVYYRDGSKQSVFQRFISHPFWQYSPSATVNAVVRVLCSPVAQGRTPCVTIQSFCEEMYCAKSCSSDSWTRNREHLLSLCRTTARPRRRRSHAGTAARRCLGHAPQRRSQHDGPQAPETDGEAYLESPGPDLSHRTAWGGITRIESG